MIQTVAVDFDGVIHAYSDGWRDGSIYDDPVPGAIAGIKQLQKRYAVFVFTSREVHPVVMWLRMHGIGATEEDVFYPITFWDSQTVVLVTQRKLPAVAYLDDRAVRFISWTSAVAQIEAAVTASAIAPRRHTVVVDLPDDEVDSDVS